MGVWDMAKLSSLLRNPESGVIVLTPHDNVDELKRELSEQVGTTTVTVLGIRAAKGLDFAEVVLVDFFKCLDAQQHKSWKKMLQSSPPPGFRDNHPEVETQLKLLYTAVTRPQQRLTMIETAPSKAASSFLAALRNKTKLVELSTNSTIETHLLTPDEWLARGLDFALEASGHTSLAGVGREHDLTIALGWLNNSIECFRKAGKVGLAYVGKAHVHTEVLRFLHNGVQKEDHESALVELVKRCITQAMWLEAHSLVSCLITSPYYQQQPEFYQRQVQQNVHAVLRSSCNHEVKGEAEEGMEDEKTVDV